MQFNQIRKQIKLLRCNKEEEEEWWFKEEDKDKWEMQEENRQQNCLDQNHH